MERNSRRTQMVYEVDQDKVKQQQYDEMKKIAERNDEISI
jgi:hypothetical protein